MGGSEPRADRRASRAASLDFYVGGFRLPGNPDSVGMVSLAAASSLQGRKPLTMTPDRNSLPQGPPHAKLPAQHTSTKERVHPHRICFCTDPVGMNTQWGNWSYGNETDTSVGQALLGTRACGKRCWELLLPGSLCRPGSQSQKDLVLNPSPALIGLHKPLALSEPYFSPL